ncbi:hypothetical protein [Microbacterium sp. PMB16]|uniref:hypothetical protein n=1 Tax=Microbacterium sp. PMB16 TaxID=3120157 RepID=UPI003F4B92D1
MLFFVVMGAVAVAGLYYVVAGIIDANEPRYWGTFTEEFCEERPRRGCQSVGTWVSDDGSIRLEGVSLDGVPGDDGTVAAQYQPAGVANDADTNIVHTSFGVSVEPFVTVGLVVLAGGVAFMQWRKWRGTWTLKKDVGEAR